MKEYLRIVRELMTQFEECHIEHIPQDENVMVDALSKYASPEIESYPCTVYYEVLRTSTININLVAPISQGSCWMDPIRAHLETGWLPVDRMEVRRISIKALRYILNDGVLYKKSFLIPYLKCMRPLEAETSLREAHEGICGQH